jgi:hypothetical protein
MGTEKPLMEHLTGVWDALEDGKLGSVQPFFPQTPGEFAGGTPNHKLLRAAVAYVDAVLLKAPGTDRAKARNLVARVFENQEQRGHGAIGQANEVLTPSHSQLWWAGAAAIYAAAATTGDDRIEPLVRRWWRAEAALCHLCGWKVDGQFRVVSPGARGGTPTKPKLTTNPARDLGYHILVTATAPREATKKGWRSQYNLGPRILLWLLRKGKLDPLRRPGEGTPLPGPNGIQLWTDRDLPELVNPLHVERSGSDFVACFDVLEALEPQWAAGVRNGEPWFVPWDGEAGTKHGGPCPVPISRLENPREKLEVRARAPQV